MAWTNFVESSHLRLLYVYGADTYRIKGKAEGEAGKLIPTFEQNKNVLELNKALWYRIIYRVSNNKRVLDIGI